jgi:hypothetical protein
MSNPADPTQIAQYLHDNVWRYHTAGGGYDVDRMAQEMVDQFAVAPSQLAALRRLAQEVAAGHCPQCGAGIQAGGRACFCCGWSPAA